MGWLSRAATTTSAPGSYVAAASFRFLLQRRPQVYTPALLLTFETDSVRYAQAQLVNHPFLTKALVTRSTRLCTKSAT